MMEDGRARGRGKGREGGRVRQYNTFPIGSGHPPG